MKSILRRLELVGSCRWNLETVHFRLHVAGEGPDLSENFHAILTFPDGSVYEGDGGDLEYSIADIVYKMPEADLFKLKVLFAENAPS